MKPSDDFEWLSDDAKRLYDGLRCKLDAVSESFGFHPPIEAILTATEARRIEQSKLPSQELVEQYQAARKPIIDDLVKLVALYTKPKPIFITAVSQISPPERKE